MRYQRLNGCTIQITKYISVEDAHEMRHVFENDELIQFARNLHDRCRQAHGGRFDRRTISKGWANAFDRVWGALFNQGGCSYADYLNFTGRKNKKGRGHYA